MAAVVITPTDPSTPRRVASDSMAGAVGPAGWPSCAPANSARYARPVRLDDAIYWRRRVVVALAGLFLLAGMAAATSRVVGGLTGSAVRSSAEPGSTAAMVSSLTGDPASRIYVVEAGDTLWSIAEELAPGSDPRPIVDRLAERAGGSSLRPGQRLSLEGLP
jgi:hypothetical protein